MGVLESMAAFCLGVGFVLGGALAAVLNPRVTFLVAGAAALAATFAFARLALRDRLVATERVEADPEPSA
jgi:hypothetical protein